jgi:hypothetical protein
MQKIIFKAIICQKGKIMYTGNNPGATCCSHDIATGRVKRSSLYFF